MFWDFLRDSGLIYMIKMSENKELMRMYELMYDLKYGLTYKRETNMRVFICAIAVIAVLALTALYLSPKPVMVGDVCLSCWGK
jgi:hypothetical protein